MLESDIYRREIDEFADVNRSMLAEFSGTRFLVTGAAGLIGSYLIDLIAAGNRKFGFGVEVYACDRDAGRLSSRFAEFDDACVRRLPLDVCRNDLPHKRFDYIIHAASNTSPVDYAGKPVDTIWTNVAGAKRLLDIAVECGVRRFLFCSSVEAYGRNNGDIENFTEDYSGYIDSNTLRAGYPSAKRCVEALCNAYAAEYDWLDFIIARIGRFFGPTVLAGDTKAPSQFLGNALDGEDVVLKSSGCQLFSWGYVSDCVTAMLKLLAKGDCGEAYNVAHPEPLSLREFAESVAECAGVAVRMSGLSAAEKTAYSKIDKATMDVKKLLALGWRPVVSLQEGVRKTYSIMKEIHG